MAGLFQVLYGKADGTFRGAEVLKGTDGEPLIIRLLVGDSVTLVSWAKGLSKEEFKKKLADWQEAFTAASSALRSAAGDGKDRAKANEEYQKVYRQRDEFMHEDRTGFVWLYLQK
jgi:hypothetical protein